MFSCAYCEFLKNIYFEKHMRTAASDYSFTSVIYLFSAAYSQKRKSFMMKKMFIGIGLCNPMTYVFKGYVKTVKICMLKCNVSTLNRLKIMLFFFANSKCIHQSNVIFNKTVTKLVTILTKFFFSISEPCKLP